MQSNRPVNHHKIPNKVRDLLRLTLLVPLPDDVREWVADALVTGALPARRVTGRLGSLRGTILCGSLSAGYDSSYGIADALQSLQYRVQYTRNARPWRSRSVRDGVASLNTVLYLHGQQQSS